MNRFFVLVFGALVFVSAGVRAEEGRYVRKMLEPDFFIPEEDKFFQQEKLPPVYLNGKNITDPTTRKSAEKESVAVRDNAGRQLTVMAYVMTDGDRWRSPALPSEYYYQGIRDGYRQNGLPLSKLKQAWEYCAKELDQASSKLNRICGGQAKLPKKQRGKER